MGMFVAACASLRPEDVPEPAPAPVVAGGAAATAVRFPGAARILHGLDFAGERQVRHGDQLLFGVTLQDGERTEHRLLRLTVRRDDPGLQTVLATMRRRDEGRVVMARPTRRLGLDLTLSDAAGVELATSHVDTMDVVLESSFVAGVAVQRRGDVDVPLVAEAQLVAIANLLATDPILKQLLAEVARVPFDLRLLWRRELTLACHFAKASVAEGGGHGPAAARFDLPFDLSLNDSLLVRLSAAVAEPHGPTAAVAGIVRLAAQQADRPDRRITLELLAAGRGPRSEFAAHGAAAFLGFVDEGLGLAFSADARWLAMPGPRGVVELRDLARDDPTMPCRLLGAPAAVHALHFLDANTLLVARGPAVECFDCTQAATGGELRPVAVTGGGEPERGGVLAIEPAGPAAVFVGWPGALVECWTFGGGHEVVQRECVRPATVETMSVRMASGGTDEVHLRRHPAPGWLLGGSSADRCIVRWLGQGEEGAGTDSLWQRRGDGSWTGQQLPPLAREWGRRARWRSDDAEAAAFDEVALGQMVARPRQGGGHAAVTRWLTLTTAGTRALGVCHADGKEFVHGFSPDGRFYAYCARGHRVLTKVPTAAVDEPPAK